MEVGLLDDQHNTDGSGPATKINAGDMGGVSEFSGHNALCPAHDSGGERQAGLRKRLRARALEAYKDPNAMAPGPAKLESLDFDSINSPYWLDLARRPPRTILGYSGKTFTRWTLSIVIGFLTALAGQFLAFGVKNLAGFRNRTLQAFFELSAPTSHAFIFFVLYNATLALIGTLITVFIEPSAAAGGIPEIKAYLNGTHVKNFLRLRAIIVKIFGTMMAVSSAMAGGQEAPMIHIGAGIASCLTRGEKHFRKLLCWNLSRTRKFESNLLRKFHNDRDRREFICAGAGAGMAAAFGAPVGGVLFVLEEAASHWSPQLIWRVFAAALVATFTLALIKSGENGGDISLAGLLSFGTVQSVEDMKRQVVSSADGTLKVSAVDAPVYWWEIIFFALVGVGGGILGGLWDLAWNALAPYRPKKAIYKVLEVVLVSLLSSTIIFSLAYSFPQCSNNGSWSCRDADNWGDWCHGPSDNTTCTGSGHAQCINASSWVCVGGENAGKTCRGRGDCEWRGGACMPVTQESRFGVQLGCPVGQFDELATIFFGTREQSIVRLFTQSGEPFSIPSLLIAGFTYIFLLMLTYGCAIPAGLFMPSVMIGGCLGRAFGQLVKFYVKDSVFSGAYALAGAAAMLGGVQRATISLVVIIIEGTANVHFLLPIVVTTCTAKLVGNLFGHEGVYEIGLRRKKLRFLEHEPSWKMDLCTAADVMSRTPIIFPVLVRVGDLLDKLRMCEHNGFPVVSMTDEGDPAFVRHDCNVSLADGLQDCKFEGLILRSQLLHILSTRYSEDGSEPSSLWYKVTVGSLEEVSVDGEPAMYDKMAYNTRLPVNVLADMSDADRARWVNIGAYMNCACYTVVESCPLSRAYKLFRDMGLRHLPVLDVQNRVIGMLARENFNEETLHLALCAYYTEEELHQQPGEMKPPRLHGNQQVARMLNRDTLVAEGGGLIGGPVHTWQTRLASILRP